MLWHISYLFWSVLYLLTLDRDYGAAKIICGPGEMVISSKSSCGPCPEGQYNSKPGSFKECRNCDPCGWNTTKVSDCTPISNTKCQCLDGFIPYDESIKNCKCPSGSGIKELATGKISCEKCPPNSPINKDNTPCLQNYVPGNTTCDVNCRNNSKTVVASSPILSQSQTSASTSSPTTSRNVYATASSFATSVSGLDDSGKHATLWLAPVAILLLLILILKLNQCLREKTEIVRQGSACGKPVEESGEKFIPTV